MKKYFYLLFLLLFSCIDKNNKDDINIISKTLFNNPYNSNIIYGYIVLGGITYNAEAVFYSNKALIYVFDDKNIIIDYYFSNFLTYKKLKNIPLGSDMEDVILKLGNPAFGSYHSSDELSPKLDINNNGFGLTYLMKRRAKNILKYEIYSRGFYLQFDNNKKLISVEEVYLGI